MRGMFSKADERVFNAGFKTLTEYTPNFTSFNGTLYEQDKTRAIVERIAVACSKLKPEFVVPEGSEGSLPRVRRLFEAWPNDYMSWPDFLRRVASILYVNTTAYVVPQYDEMGNIIGLFPMKPSHAEVIEYEGEPWIRFHLLTGDVQVFPFYEVAILTRFQLDSDIFGGGNKPLTQTLRLMDAQRQAEEIALKTGADIRFIGKLSGMVHEKDMEKKRDRFANANLNPNVNSSGLLLYDQTFEDIEQIKPQNYTIDTDEMERIDKSLYAYFGINEKILNNTYNEAEWSAFYEGVVEPFGIMLASRLTMMLLTPTQVRKGNHIMFSSGYLEYATTDSKIKVANLFMTAGIGMRNEVRDIFQLPHTPGGNVFTFRGEYYQTDENGNIIAMSGGRPNDDATGHVVTVDYDDDLDEPDDLDDSDDDVN